MKLTFHEYRRWCKRPFALTTPTVAVPTQVSTHTSVGPSLQASPNPGQAIQWDAIEVQSPRSSRPDEDEDSSLGTGIGLGKGGKGRTSVQGDDMVRPGPSLSSMGHALNLSLGISRGGDDGRPLSPSVGIKDHDLYLDGTGGSAHPHQLGDVREPASRNLRLETKL
jgi:hypothetical protein